ncbi:MAG TPA: hypothetical protein VIJ31_10590 [Acidothermaceae bacterium]
MIEETVITVPVGTEQVLVRDGRFVAIAGEIETDLGAAEVDRGYRFAVNFGPMPVDTSSLWVD